MPETNQRAKRCLLCEFAIEPGHGRIAGTSWVHSDPTRCAALKQADKERIEQAIRRRALRERLIARINRANQQAGAAPSQ